MNVMITTRVWTTIGPLRTATAAAIVLGFLLDGIDASAAPAAAPQAQPPAAIPPCPPFMSPEAYAAARQSAVDIFITHPTKTPNVFSAIVGAGFVIDKSGYVLTCSHVAGFDGTRTVGLHDAVKFEDGLPFRVVARNDALDIGVIKIDAPGREFSPAKIGRSAALRVGDHVAVIGNPDGERHSVATGKLTALQANWGYQWGSGGTWHHDFLACNAPATHGHSGARCSTLGEKSSACFQET